MIDHDLQLALLGKYGTIRLQDLSHNQSQHLARLINEKDLIFISRFNLERVLAILDYFDNVVIPYLQQTPLKEYEELEPGLSKLRIFKENYALSIQISANKLREILSDIDNGL